jgi:hypothetical protein
MALSTEDLPLLLRPTRQVKGAILNQLESLNSLKFCRRNLTEGLISSTIVAFFMCRRTFYSSCTSGHGENDVVKEIHLSRINHPTLVAAGCLAFPLFLSLTKSRIVGAPPARSSCPSPNRG